LLNLFGAQTIEAASRCSLFLVLVALIINENYGLHQLACLHQF
jgi:hypothetical protein